jgi:predicted PhzF superfamily epimerase YddE/YHI9
MRTSELLCFGATSGTGNPALVVEDGPADALARQALARERNITVVFIDHADGQPILDYWYPHTRSPLCLHATLAAAHILFAHQQPPAAPIPSAPPPPSFPRRREPNFPGPPPTLTVTTAVAHQPLILSRDADDFYVQLSEQPAPALPALPDIAALLSQPGLVPTSPPRIASVGSPKLLVEVPDTATLYGLDPDLAAITAWGKENAVNGLYVWCRHPDGRYEGRNFNHLDPALEDAATGVAAGALTAMLGHDIVLRQGKATGRACVIRTGVGHDAVLVGGRVELA